MERKKCSCRCSHHRHRSCCCVPVYRHQNGLQHAAILFLFLTTFQSARPQSSQKPDPSLWHVWAKTHVQGVVACLSQGLWAGYCGLIEPRPHPVPAPVAVPYGPCSPSPFDVIPSRCSLLPYSHPVPSPIPVPVVAAFVVLPHTTRPVPVYIFVVVASHHAICHAPVIAPFQASAGLHTRYQLRLWTKFNMTTLHVSSSRLIAIVPVVPVFVPKTIVPCDLNVPRRLRLA